MDGKGDDTVKAVQILPEGYKEIYAVDLHKNKKMALLVNFLAAIISLVCIVPMVFAVPISNLFITKSAYDNYRIRAICLIVFMLLYMVLHELVHGIAMRMCGTKKVRYGLIGLYAFAASDDYYNKRAYIFIALAPIVLLGCIIAVVNCFVPVEWFWVVYMVQVLNLSGAAGDLFVTIKFSRLPKDILIKDHGVGMEVFSKE